MKKKISRRSYYFSKQTENGKVFIINRNNEYCFRKGLFTNYSIKSLYLKYGNDMIEYLEMIYDNQNIIDKKVILEILRELKTYR